MIALERLRREREQETREHAQVSMEREAVADQRDAALKEAARLAVECADLKRYAKRLIGERDDAQALVIKVCREREEARTEAKTARDVMHKLLGEAAALREAMGQILGEQRTYGWSPPEALIDHLREAISQPGPGARLAERVRLLEDVAMASRELIEVYPVAISRRGVGGKLRDAIAALDAPKEEP